MTTERQFPVTASYQERLEMQSLLLGGLHLGKGGLAPDGSSLLSISVF
jgi:hypothetical protein